MAAWIRTLAPIAALGLALVCAAAPAQADVLYGTSVVGASPRSSDYGSTDQFGFRTFDNFSVAGGGSVTRLTWSGFWFGPVVPDPAPMPDALSWDIAFHASSGGAAPGAQLSLQNYLASQVTSTFLGTGLFSVSGTNYNVRVYELSVDLPSAFDVSAGTEYWLSIMARSDSFDPIFAWRAGDGGDNNSYQQQLGAGESVVSSGSVARDRHLVIEGTFAVPEPDTLPLVLAALVGWSAFARRSAARPRGLTPR